MLKSLITGALLAVLATPALAQRQGGYAVEGQGADGQRYQGTLALEQTGQHTWRVTWRVGGDTAHGVGLLIPQGPLLIVGYSAGGQEIGVAAYAVQPDGSLRGTWTQGTGGGIGTETLTPAGGGGGAARK